MTLNFHNLRKPNIKKLGLNYKKLVELLRMPKILTRYSKMLING